MSDEPMSAERALEWMDTAIAELEGALEAVTPHLDAGTVAGETVSAKINGLFLRVMQKATAGAPA